MLKTSKVNKPWQYTEGVEEEKQSLRRIAPECRFNKYTHKIFRKFQRGG